MRVRIKFAKKESVKYLGHLDIMRFFQRCFNRAGIRMEYSEGFNPHQKMSFAQPLGVGILSCGEYLDAEIAEGQDPEKVKRCMNAVCGEGFEVLDVRIVKENAKKAMAALRAASYSIDLAGLFSDSSEDARQALLRAVSEVLNAGKIPVLKRTKSGEKEVDIRPQILALSLEDTKLLMTVTAASDNNLKAETLLKEIISKADIEYDREMVTIERTELFAEDLLPLSKFQTIG